ncbi:MAG: NAD(P)-dependent oxidoreductase [Chlamydiales bacterium]|nr:NAD(P)-dependent oxidoreductase [Chlamydiia bacterium]MCP5507385.1 NAD(P)-dependent oxidoreductase [Chlamydiales bacterium]
MRILFTGASSFTGMWFVKELAAAGHEVHAPLLHSRSEYSGTRLQRVQKLKEYATLYDNIPFGSRLFLDLIETQPSWDLFCHHAADVTDYKNPQFDYAAALANNTHNLEEVLGTLQNRGCHRILLTGSIFEQGEGEGNDDLRAVSPYGLSKGLTSAVFTYFAAIKKMSLGKFVIPNPFGPYEEFRFTSFLVKTWYEEKVASVTHPDYLRDNIPVSLLAKAYSHFADDLDSYSGFHKLNPSGYTGTVGEFTALFAEALRPRLFLPCEYDLKPQEDYSEPRTRINSDVLDHTLLQWDEDKAWDDLARYYKETYGS